MNTTLITILININNSVLAGKVAYDKLPLFLCGLLPLFFNIGTKLNLKFITNTKWWNLFLWFLYLTLNFLFLNSSNLFLICLLFLLIGSCQTNLIINDVKKINSNKYLIMFSFMLGRLIGGFSGIIFFKYIFIAQIVIFIIFWILTYYKKIQKLYKLNLNLNKINFLNKSEFYILFITHISLLATINYIFNFNFHQKSFVVALVVFTSLLLVILILTNIKLTLKLFNNRYILYLLIYILLLTYLFTFNLFIGIILVYLILFTCEILINSSKNILTRRFFIINLISLIISSYIYNCNIVYIFYFFTLIFTLLLIKTILTYFFKIFK